MTSVTPRVGGIVDSEQSIERFHDAILQGKSRNSLGESVATVSQESRRQRLSLVDRECENDFRHRVDQDFPGLTETVPRLLRGSCGLLGGHEPS